LPDKTIISVNMIITVNVLRNFQTLLKKQETKVEKSYDYELFFGKKNEISVNLGHFFTLTASTKKK